jgi:hypothetical protein
MELQLVECPHVLHAFKRQSFPYARLLKVMLFFSPKAKTPSICKNYSEAPFPLFQYPTPPCQYLQLDVYVPNRACQLFIFPGAFCVALCVGLRIMQYVCTFLPSP